MNDKYEIQQQHTFSTGKLNYNFEMSFMDISSKWFSKCDF